jgi:predicted 2-oxoglutarate/Fe(II)-dependent dioxygenase YbiX
MMPSVDEPPIFNRSSLCLTDTFVGTLSDSSESLLHSTRAKLFEQMLCGHLRALGRAYNPASLMEPLLLENVLDEATRMAFLVSLRAADSVTAVVYGGAAPGVDLRVRSVQALQASDAMRESTKALLAALRPKIAAHFGIGVESIEEPQFLRYVPGDFFVAHQDGNTGLVRDDSEHRRISVVLFLNARSLEPQADSYCGGELMLHGRYPDWERRYIIPALPGSLVAFRSETTHEVMPVVHGHRYTIVSWYR